MSVIQHVRSLFYGNRVQAPALIPSDQAEKALEKLCRPPFSPEKFLRIADLLAHLDSLHGRERGAVTSWHYRPRIYAVLRNIAPGQHEEYMRLFIEGNYTDFNLPFDERTSPRFLTDPGLKTTFFEFQQHVLAELRFVEIDGGEHQNVGGSADSYFQRLDFLGQGGFGQVDKVWSKLSFRTYARKRIPRRRDSVRESRLQRAFIQEVEILKRLSHRHLVKYIGSYTDEKFIAYLMEPVAECNLVEFLEELGKPGGQKRKREVPRFYGCLASAIHYLHETERVRHTDITTRNILVSESNVFISDFGTATDFSKTGKSTTNDDYPVSIEYIAPEVARRHKRNKASDMWSLGVVFLEITTVLLDHDLTHFRNFMAKNAEDKDHAQSIWANLSTAKDWLTKIRSPCANSANEAITWVSNLLQANPKHRLSAKTLMVDIRQTESFKQFCCVDCWDEYETGAFEFEAPTTSSGYNAVTQHETAADFSARARAIFEPAPAPIPRDSARTQSIEKWILHSAGDTVDADLSVGTWDHSPAEQPRRKPSLHSLTESLGATSYTTAIPIAESHRAPDHALPLQMPGAFPEENDVVDSGFGYLVEDDRSSEDEQDKLQRHTEIFQGFIVENDSSESEEVYSDKSIRTPDTEDFPSRSGGDSEAASLTDSGHPTKGETSPVNELHELQDEESLHRVFPKNDPEISECPSVTADQEPQVSPAVQMLEEEVGIDHDGSIVVRVGRSQEAEIPSEVSILPNDVPEFLQHAAAATPSDSISDLPAELTVEAEELRPGKRVRFGEITVGEVTEVRETESESGTEPASDVSSGRQESGEESEDTSENVDEDQDRPHSPEIATDTNGIGSRQTPPPAGAAASRSGIGAWKRPSRAKPNTPKKGNARPPGSLGAEGRGGEGAKKRVPVEVPSPTLFMEDARKAGQRARSIATSQMTSRTQQTLAGVNINRWMDKTQGLLELYCAKGNVAAVRILLQQKCNPGTKNKPRPRPLLVAIKGATVKHSKVVRALIQHGANVHIKDNTRNWGKTTLHLAIENNDNPGYVNTVHDMVFAGVDPNAKDRAGECALEKIFKDQQSRGLAKYRLDALALLLLSDAKGGTQVNIQFPATLDTPLHLAIRRRSPMAAAMLLHKGADVNATNASGITPLLSAALLWRGGTGASSQLARDDEQMLDLLTSQPGIKLDECAGELRRTALHHAVAASLPLAVQILLENGADRGRRDAHQKTPLELLAPETDEESSDIQLIRRLLTDAPAE